MPSVDLPLTARIIGLRDVGGEVSEIVLQPLPGRRLPAFEAGAHIDVGIRTNAVRQFSLLNDPAERDRYVIAVKRSPASSGAADADPAQLVVGRQIRIGVPRNLFALERPLLDVSLVAGGIGLTPMLAMGHTLARTEAPFALHISARSRDALPYANELDRLPFASRIRLHFDDGPSAQHLGDEDLGPWSPGRTLYLCGPAGFMTAVMARTRRLRWPDSAIHTESFAPVTADAR